jgi:hypothetical protein
MGEPESAMASACPGKRMRGTVRRKVAAKFLLLARLHQLDSIFAIFGAVSGGKPLYFRVWQIETRL